MRAWLRVGAILGLTALAAAGCAPERPAPMPTPEYTSTYAPPPEPVFAPLTGEAVAAPITTPSIAGKVDNHPDARPQFGLERADIVFEELVEGGLTRYVPIWHSDVPAEIGPVRSIRPMDPDILSPFGGIVAYSGGQYQFVVMMQETNVVNAIHGQADTDDTFYRTDLKGSPHDVLVLAPQVIAQHAELSPPQQQFGYSLDVPSATAAKDGERIDVINLVIGGSATPSWGWDAAKAAYNRFMTGGAPDTDQAGAQLTATNLVVLRVPVTWDYRLPKTELIGGGEAWVSTGGGTVHGSWSKPDRGALIRLVDDRGVPIRLAPGNTWIELVPLEGSAEFIPPPPEPPAPTG